MLKIIGFNRDGDILFRHSIVAAGCQPRVNQVIVFPPIGIQPITARSELDTLRQLSFIKLAIHNRQLNALPSIKGVDELCIRLHQGGLLFFRSQLIVDIRQLQRHGVLVPPKRADAVLDHRLILDDSLSGVPFTARNIILLAAPFTLLASLPIRLTAILRIRVLG